MTNTSETKPNSGINRPIVFFGTEEHSILVLRPLVEAGYNISAIITKPDSRRGRGQRLSAPPIKEYGLAQSINVLQPNQLDEIIDEIKGLAHPIGILASYGRIIPESIINLFTPGIINVHPSLLPQYRGPTPIESAIKNRDQQTGVSIMGLSREMDAGPIYIQSTYPLDLTEVQSSLRDKLFEIGAELLVRCLPDIINLELKPTPQDSTKATYCKLLTRQDGRLNLSVISSTQAEAEIRAYATYPRSRVKIGDFEIIITQAHISTNKKTPLDLLCSDGAYLSIDQLIAPSGKTMSADEFLRGYHIND